MTKNIPVKTVGVLLVAVALLAVMGTFVVVSGPMVTGMGTGSGTASVQMSADTTISTPTMVEPST